MRVFGLLRQAVEQSHAALDSVFNFEKLSSQQVPPDRKYAYEDRQNVNIRTYGESGFGTTIASIPS